MATAIRLGRAHGDHILIEIGGREHPSATDFDDGNWLVSQVSVRAGAFAGRFGCSLRSEESAAFLGELRQLNNTLTGEAVFQTLEEQLRVRVSTVGSLGGIIVTASARDQAGVGNLLEFHLEDYDQTDLGSLIADVEEVAAMYPVIGRAAFALYRSMSHRGRREPPAPEGPWRWTVLMDGAMVGGELAATPHDAPFEVAAREMSDVLRERFAVLGAPLWTRSPGPLEWWEAPVKASDG